jgi:hypothetical protein
MGQLKIAIWGRDGKPESLKQTLFGNGTQYALVSHWLTGMGRRHGHGGGERRDSGFAITQVNYARWGIVTGLFSHVAGAGGWFIAGRWPAAIIRNDHPARWPGLSRNHAIETQRLLGLFAQGLRREALPDP